MPAAGEGSKTMKGRSIRRLALLAAVAATAASGTAWADACSGSKRWGGGSPASIPDCELQVQAPVSYSGWETKGWAYLCGGDHPYFWGLYASYSPSYTSNNNCFSISENAVNEAGDNSKFDATFTNWCFKKESITITLACSDQVPPSPLSQDR